ncbi:unnamed protein product [Eruca vesicaria subsp. sativa]|uniref:LOB domain-containing protein n=1 Tax=Eruca vesicaria subsp. sativa TaxID=29727 RepID=A0ABC8JGX8_ERUVS|nr:unnamed protein product [Eruca vesicaria subsp. sativa]
MSTPRRKCTKDCVFAPYLPANKLDKYATVHKIFGASKIAKLLNVLHSSQRENAMISLLFEAQAGLLDPCQLKNIEDPRLETLPPVTYQQNQHNSMMMPVMANNDAHLTAEHLAVISRTLQQLRQLHEEAHHFESQT